MKEVRLPYLLSAPAILLMLVVDLYPLLYTVNLSVHRVKLLLREDPFIGFQNYLHAFTDPAFWEALLNSALWSLCIVGLGLLVGLGQALFLDSLRIGRGFMRAVVFIPYIIPSVVLAMMWKLIFEQGPAGLVNHLMLQFGFIHQPILWLSSKWSVLFVVISAAVWRASGFFAIMLLAGLQAIPRQIIDAGRIDGCSNRDLLRWIILPMLRNVMVISSTIYWIWMFNWLDLIWLMSKGGPGTSTHILTSYAYQKAFRGWDFGYAGALSMITILIVVVVAIFVLNRARESVQAMGY